MNFIYSLHLLFSALASVLRLGAGAPPKAQGSPETESSSEPLIVYEFEGCPHCRISREAISESGEAVLIRPCPKGGTRFRPAVKKLGGKSQFPFMIDPGNETAIYESADIAKYILQKNGATRPALHLVGPLNLLLSQLGVFMRLFAGTFRRPARHPDQPLEFCGVERDPRARLVKERLCEMEIEYLWRPIKGEPQLIDPNRDETIIGAGAIREYLTKTYAR